MIEKRLKKIIRQLLLIFCTQKKKKYIQVISQKLIKSQEKVCKNKNFRGITMPP